jgi:L-ascorbate metabolism protein UlaG (beta-lactamase superfamily)
MKKTSSTSCNGGRHIVMIAAIAMLASLSLSACAKAQAQTADAATIASVAQNIRWLGQSSIRIEAEKKIIYIDPLFIDKTDKADLILITHTHGDHYVYRNVQLLQKKDTIVVAPTDLGFGNRVMKPGTATKLAGFSVEAVPAYNIVKTQNHPKDAGNNGYIITVDGVRVYHAGDTERIPEMKNMACDIALMPLGQVYTMNSVDEAIDATLDVKAKIAVPIHYGMYEGSLDDAHQYADKLRASGITVEIKEKK